MPASRTPAGKGKIKSVKAWAVVVRNKIHVDGGGEWMTWRRREDAIYDTLAWPKGEAKAARVEIRVIPTPKPKRKRT